MDFAKLDFQQLRIKHISFKSKVRMVLFGGNFDSAFLAENNPVNEWFATVGQVKYGGAPEIRQLQALQQEMARLAQRLISLYQRDQIDQAHNGLAELNEKSDLFLLLLDQLQQRLT